MNNHVQETKVLLAAFFPQSTASGQQPGAVRSSSKGLTSQGLETLEAGAVSRQRLGERWLRAADQLCRALAARAAPLPAAAGGHVS